jgi:hypothetical protein
VKTPDSRSARAVISPAMPPPAISARKNPVPLREWRPTARAAHAAGDCSSEPSGGQIGGTPPQSSARAHARDLSEEAAPASGPQRASGRSSLLHFNGHWTAPGHEAAPDAESESVSEGQEVRDLQALPEWS